jgi:tetratricopeptide (TPR) repeat protein
MSEREDSTEIDPDDEAGMTKREGHGARAKVAPVQLARGTPIGRYLALDKLGEGGMGVVYGAFDPELDRKVAIKLLQVGTGSSGGDRAWLLREAQALARLAHPNVVAVYDVGTLADEQVFVAMELVDGMTMREWLRVQERSWREVLPVMRAAGAGLAAAHHAGLVHRDFKPENILVGRDGRARVMDFGLARLRPDDAAEGLPPSQGSEPAFESRTPLPSELTFAGHLVGTPAYMAPELYDGHTADARTDQFAFGVALFEALHWARPYSKKELARAKKAPPKPKIPEKPRVPARLQRIALRACAIDPVARYASMDELLAELEVDPLVNRRRAALAGAAAVFFGGAVLGAYAMTSHGDKCAGYDHRLAGAWDPDVKATVKRAFLAVKKPFAAPAYAGLERALDGYARDWVAGITGSCKETRVRGEQSEDLMVLREACYEERLDELHALTALLANADARLVEKGDSVAIALEPLKNCANAQALLAPDRPSPMLREQARSLDKKIAEAKAAMIAGQYLPAMVAAKQVADGATQLGYQPLVAKALVIRGTALLLSQNVPDAEQAFADATYAAMRGKRDDIAAEAGLAAAMAIAENGGRPDLAKIWLGHAVAAAERVGYERQIERRRLEVEGLVAVDSGDLNLGIAKHEQALEVVKRELGESAPDLLNDEILLATTLSKAGAFTRAVPHFQHALELREASVGKEHPDIGTLESDLGAAYTHAGDYAKAHAAFAHALAIREAYYGKNSPMLIATLDNFGELLRHEKDYAGAITAQQRAIAMARVVPGTEHSMYHQLATDYSDTLIAAGKLADAHKWLDELLALERRTSSSVLPATLAARAELALADRAWSDAQAFAEQSIAGYETAGGKDDPALWRPLTALGRAQLELGRPAPARATLSRALAIGEKGQIDAIDLAQTRDTLGKLP